MTLVQLRHLIALAESGSFSRAAEALFLTQPALSRSIRALEDELGQPVFDRGGRRSALTPFGEEVLQRARQLVSDADDLGAIGERLRAGLAGRLRIGLGSGPGALLMTPLMMRMAATHPRLRLEISRGRTESLAQALRERRLDALVVDRRSLAPTPELRVELPVEMRAAFLCRPGHPLRARRRPVGFEQLRRFPIASTPLSDEVARLLVERYGPDAHPQACVTLSCEEVPSLVEVARRTDAILLAVRALAPDLAELPLRPALDATARYALVTLARRAEAPALPLVRRMIGELLRDPAS